jgi:hypothetical protein
MYLHQDANGNRSGARSTSAPSHAAQALEGPHPGRPVLVDEKGGSCSTPARLTANVA